MKIAVSKMLAFTAFVFGGFGAFAAVQLTFKCSPKAYACTPGGDCRWNQIYEGVPTTIVLEQDGQDQNVHRARYQTLLDGHQLTLDFKVDQSNTHRPLRVNAYLSASNVLAESSGTDRIDLALRNNSFGRGFLCTNIHVD